MQDVIASHELAFRENWRLVDKTSAVTASWAFSRFARTAANFAADLERPPRRPILDRYLVTSEGMAERTQSRFHRQATPSGPEILAEFHHLLAGSLV